MSAARRRPWQDPPSFALSLIGAVLVLLGLSVIDSVLVTAVGTAITLAGLLVSRRTRRRLLVVHRRSDNIDAQG